MKIKKIVILGPESTGKSTLCEALAKHYEVLWCPEYARQYLSEHGTKYTYDDLSTIAKGQLTLEDRFVQNSIVKGHDKIIIDTDMHVMKVWCEYVFNNAPTFILEEINNREYDLYLLCNIDLKWTSDEMREYPEEGPREELFNIYKDILINQNTPWAIISGIGAERTNNAIQYIDSLLAS